MQSLALVRSVLNEERLVGLASLVLQVGRFYKLMYVQHDSCEFDHIKYFVVVAVVVVVNLVLAPARRGCVRCHSYLWWVMPDVCSVSRTYTGLFRYRRVSV